MLDREMGVCLEAQVIQPWRFFRNGLEVEEVICKWETDGKLCYKLIWIHHPMSYMELDGKKNPFFHADFWVSKEAKQMNSYEDLRQLEQAARRKVMKAFDEYWSEK